VTSTSSLVLRRAMAINPIKTQFDYKYIDEFYCNSMGGV